MVNGILVLSVVIELRGRKGGSVNEGGSCNAPKRGETSRTNWSYEIQRPGLKPMMTTLGWSSHSCCCCSLGVDVEGSSERSDA